MVSTNYHNSKIFLKSLMNNNPNNRTFRWIKWGNNSYTKLNKDNKSISWWSWTVHDIIKRRQSIRSRVNLRKVLSTLRRMVWRFKRKWWITVSKFPSWISKIRKLRKNLTNTYTRPKIHFKRKLILTVKNRIKSKNQKVKAKATATALIPIYLKAIAMLVKTSMPVGRCTMNSRVQGNTNLAKTSDTPRNKGKALTPRRHIMGQNWERRSRRWGRAGTILIKIGAIMAGRRKVQKLHRNKWWSQSTVLISQTRESRKFTLFLRSKMNQSPLQRLKSQSANQIKSLEKKNLNQHQSQL